MSKEELQTIILTIQAAATVGDRTYIHMCSVLYTFTVELFGKTGAQHFWLYVYKDTNKSDCPFETIDELYDFLSDPRIQYIKETPMSLGDMIDRNPNDDMYHNLAKVIYFENFN